MSPIEGLDICDEEVALGAVREMDEAHLGSSALNQDAGEPFTPSMLPSLMKTQVFGIRECL